MYVETDGNPSPKEPNKIIMNLEDLNRITTVFEFDEPFTIGSFGEYQVKAITLTDAGTEESPFSLQALALSDGRTIDMSSILQINDGALKILETQLVHLFSQMSEIPRTGIYIALDPSRQNPQIFFKGQTKLFYSAET